MAYARVIDPYPEDFPFNFPKRRWAVTTEHTFRDGEGQDSWYLVFNTRHEIEY